VGGGEKELPDAASTYPLVAGADAFLDGVGRRLLGGLDEPQDIEVAAQRHDEGERSSADWEVRKELVNGETV
jgi:hypothetical protein